MDNVKLMENFPTVKIVGLTASNGYTSLRALLTAASKDGILGNRPTVRVVIQGASANINLASSSSPETEDVIVIGTSSEPLTIASLGALDQVFVDDGAGTATFKLLIYLA